MNAIDDHEKGFNQCLALMLNLKTKPTEEKTKSVFIMKI